MCGDTLSFLVPSAAFWNLLSRAKVRSTRGGASVNGPGRVPNKRSMGEAHGRLVAVSTSKEILDAWRKQTPFLDSARKLSGLLGQTEAGLWKTTLS